MKQGIMKLYKARIFALVLTAIGVTGARAAPELTATPLVSSRIDAPITPANSVLIDFGDGAIMRIPKILVSTVLIPKDPKQPIKADQLSITFQYPDMVQSSYQGDMGKIIERKDGSWGWSLTTPVKFPVNIVRVFHSTEDMTSVDTRNATRGPDWRPLDRLHFVEATVRNDGRLHDFHGLPDATITLVESKYEGLQEIRVPITDREYYDRSRKMWRESGWNGEEGAQYVERIGSPYELYMTCEAPSSTKCEADVYIKSNHFQYKMVFPPESVAHADSLIRSINKMIDNWKQK